MARHVTRISSKLIKTNVLRRSPRLRVHIPETRRYNHAKLKNMLERYGMIYMKPTNGSLGVGVMRVEQSGGKYRYQLALKKGAFPTFRALCSTLDGHVKDRGYLIQRGIRTLRREGRMFDFRVLIQRNPAGKWECTGTAGRVAHPGKIVSNGSQGGTIYSPNALLQPSAGSSAAARVQRKMNRLAKQIAAQFSKSYPGMNELGIDIAVDQRLKPWILEVNTAPDPCPFTKLPDPSVIRRIVRYARAYGQTYRLKCNKAKRA